MLPQISIGLSGAILKGSLNLDMTRHRDQCHRLVLRELLQKLLQLTLQPASRFVRSVVEIDQEHVPNASSWRLVANDDGAICRTPGWGCSDSITQCTMLFHTHDLLRGIVLPHDEFGG